MKPSLNQAGLKARRGNSNIVTLHVMVMWMCFVVQREWETMAAEQVDDLLESFMGIRDTELGESFLAGLKCSKVLRKT